MYFSSPFVNIKIKYLRKPVIYLYRTGYGAAIRPQALIWNHAGAVEKLSMREFSLII